MSTLRVTVEWLGGACHAREWPPSPLRLYQAMLAGSAVHRRADPAFEAALRHLETLPAPAVTAPVVESETQVTASVPNNDGDRVLALHARGRTDAARTLGPKLRTLRTRRTRRFSGAVSYDWTATAETAGHLECLAAMAGCVTSVGHGVDTALARAALIEHAAPAPGVRYAPDGLGRHRLDVPWPGAFDALERRYRAERGRIVGKAVSMVPEPARRAVRYRSALEPPRLRSEAFALVGTDERPVAFAGTRAMEVAAMVRHAVGTAARIAGLDERTRSALMGHGDEAERAPGPAAARRRPPPCRRMHPAGDAHRGARGGRGRLVGRGDAPARSAARSRRRGHARRGARTRRTDRPRPRPVPGGGAPVDNRHPGGAPRTRPPQRPTPAAPGPCAGCCATQESPRRSSRR